MANWILKINDQQIETYPNDLTQRQATECRANYTIADLADRKRLSKADRVTMETPDGRTLHLDRPEICYLGMNDYRWIEG